LNAGILIIAREKYFGPSFHYSNIPVNPPNPPLIKEGGELELGCFTQIGLDDLRVILDDLRRTFCDPLSEI
jgi:hypothetical protein